MHLLNEHSAMFVRLLLYFIFFILNSFNYLFYFIVLNCFNYSDF